MSDSKKRLFEIMGRLDPTFKHKPVLKEEKRANKYKKQINEYSNYPAGADYESDAPWNEAPEAEWSGEIYVEPSDNIEDFIITMYSNSPAAHADVNLYTLVQKYAQGQDDYFLEAIAQPNPKQNPELMNKVDQMLKLYAESGELNWEYDED